MIAALPFRCGICYLIHYHSVMTMLPPKYYLSTLEKELSFQEMLFVFGSIHPLFTPSDSCNPFKAVQLKNACGPISRIRVEACSMKAHSGIARILDIVPSIVATSLNSDVRHSLPASPSACSKIVQDYFHWSYQKLLFD